MQQLNIQEHLVYDGRLKPSLTKPQIVTAEVPCFHCEYIRNPPNESGPCNPNQCRRLEFWLLQQEGSI